MAFVIPLSTVNYSKTTSLFPAAQTLIQPHRPQPFHLPRSYSHKTASVRTRITAQDSSTPPPQRPPQDGPVSPLGVSTNGDVLKLGFICIVVPILVYKGLVFAGVDGIQAGQWITAFVFVGGIIGWTSTYLFRVAEKKTTYATQLREYEDAVLQKRISELTEEEIEALVDGLDDDFEQKAKNKK